MVDRRYQPVRPRTQGMLLPPCLDDYVSEHNPVRAIDAFVDTLDPASPEDARQCSIDARARGARRASIRHDQALGGNGSFSDARTRQVPCRVGGWRASHWDHSLDRVSSPPLIKPDVRISRIRLTDEITLARVIRSGVCDAL